MTSKEIKALLFKKYSPPAFAFFVEVANGTGSNASRYADGVAVNLWPSQGYEITGFEIKVSRQDFLNELKQPWKAGSVMAYCSRWYIVAPKGLIHKDEIPENWGFIEVLNGKLFTKKVAPPLKRDPIDMAFTCALLRRATENSIPLASLEGFREECRVSAKENAEANAGRLQERFDSLQKKVIDFEDASGIKIENGWQGAEKIGDAVRYVLDGRLKEKTRWNFERTIEGLEGIIDQVKVHQKDIEKI